MKYVLRNVGVINPNNIDEYIAADGYKALAKALKSAPAQIIEEVKRSGLRGRGGAGFPTGRKWEFVADEKGPQKYIVCNGDEGDPGAFMDRAILEGDPHSVIEGMAVAAKAVGANRGFVYVRAEYPQAVQNLKIAIEQARTHGFLNKDFNIEIRLGAGAYVCGEETALLASIEGRRGEPNPRPPYPAVSGLYGKPTLINNVETFANIAPIILHGADSFPNTKVFAVSGNVANGGLVEVKIGTTIDEVVNRICGGALPGRKIKAVQIGGPSGGCIPASMFGTPLDYESIAAAGAILGSGGLVVIDDKTCIVDFAKFFIKFSADESCGKCTPCRVGNKKLLGLLDKITCGNGTDGDIEKIINLSNTIIDTSLCGLGQSSPNPVLSTLRHFREEYIEHLHGKCRCGVCFGGYKITDKCVGCGLCAKNCPTKAIVGVLRVQHKIDASKCVKCGLCASLCPVHAIRSPAKGANV
jgi:NADP-reducing hydrogenase subunit HndC